MGVGGRRTAGGPGQALGLGRAEGQGRANPRASPCAKHHGMVTLWSSGWQGATSRNTPGFGCLLEDEAGPALSTTATATIRCLLCAGHCSRKRNWWDPPTPHEGGPVVYLFTGEETEAQKV